jgi:proline iminopeptidase
MVATKKTAIALVIIIPTIFFMGNCTLLDPDQPGNLVPATVDEDPSLSYIEVNGTRLRSETFGDPADPVIIFLHGGPGDAYESLTRLAGLSDEYFLVFFDQRGSGLSRRHSPEDISDQHIIEDLDQIIDMYKRNPDDKINLICHSWGAQYATMYIDHDPARAMQKIDKMVFSDPGPFNSEWMKYVAVDLDMSLDWFNGVLWNNEFISPDTHARADYYGYMTGKNSNPDRHYSKTDPSPKLRWGSVMTITLRDVQGKNGWDWTARLAEYTNKVLFIRAGLNEDHTPEYFDLLMEPYPMTELVTIDDVGHDLAWVKSDEYMTVVRTYFAE